MKQYVKKAIILAGGLGERLRPFTNEMPKPMYPINGIPFIERIITQVTNFGIKDFVILLGYKADKVIDYLGDGSKYNVNITYDITPVEYDTLERIMHAREYLDNNNLLLYCDNYCPIDFEQLIRDTKRYKSLIQLSVYNNKDNYTKSNLIINKNNRVEKYDKKRESSNLQGVEIGYMIFKKKVLDLVTNEKNLSDIFPKLIDMKRLYATRTDHRYYSIGSFERINLTEMFFQDKKAVFLDRDGTLNVKAPKACYIEKKEDFVWLEGAIEAIKLLNDNNYITILITNQPGIARGNLTVDRLNEIHDKMKNDLSKYNAHIDYIYYCPHNWDEGCFCRKPKPGMFFQAARDLCLNLRECAMFGDDERDMEAAISAGVKPILVTEENNLLKAVKEYINKED